MVLHHPLRRVPAYDNSLLAFLGRISAVQSQGGGGVSLVQDIRESRVVLSLRVAVAK